MRRIALVAVLLAFAVVVLGAYVRLTTAGLGCPDWPGCYGHIAPTGTAVDVGKAWREMIHRYFAGTLVILTLILAVMALSQKRARSPGGASVPLTLAVVATIFVQALLGMLTVTWQVAPQIVTLHLLFGMTTLGLLWWLWLTLDARIPRTTSPSLGRSPPVGWAHSNTISRRLALIGSARAGRADRAGRLDQHQLCGDGLPGLPHLPGLVVAAHGFRPCLRTVALAHHEL